LAAPSELAFDPDFPSHHADEPAGYGEPEARSPIFSRGGGIRLGKWIEDRLQFFVRNPDPRVRDYKVQSVIVLTDRFHLDLYGHLALVGEFNGVACQVDNDLTQPAGISLHEFRHLRSHFA